MVTRAADYALRACLTLAGLPPGVRLCLSELAERCDVPPAYLYKVLQSLARRGLLTPYRGITGGYELTAQARESSVLDVVEAVNGLPLLNSCVLSGGCHRAPTCPAHPVWWEAQARMREVLAAARLSELARAQTGAVPLIVRRARAGRPSRARGSVEVCGRRPARRSRQRSGTH